MTAPKFRYLIITEDDEVLGTNDSAIAMQYAADLCSIIDVVKGTVAFDELDDGQEIDEAVELESDDAEDGV
jgi:hypothetical protein